MSKLQFVCSLLLFCNCCSFHCIERPNFRLNNFVVWFSTWSSMIVITDEGRNPKQDGSNLILYRQAQIAFFFLRLVAL